MDFSEYKDVLASRYISEDMSKLFSEQHTIETWRKCWVALAEAEKELGLKIITSEMITAMKKNIKNIDFKEIKKKEKEIRHDVMANIHAYAKVAPKADKIIHLGATSQFVKCNSDLIIIKESTQIIKKRLLLIIKDLAALSDKFKKTATLSFTHYQVSQPTTIGKRFALYLQDMLMDLDNIESSEKHLKARGVKGTTGTQDSFLKLFNGNHKKVKKLDLLVSKKLGFDESFPLGSQTYSRKLDIKISEMLSGIASTCYKMAVDVRLLSNQKVLDEPFEKNQTGSSAMPYKRNPIRAERICSLARKVMNLNSDFYDTYSNQWLERTLDDSAIRRIDIPQMFIITDVILRLLRNIINGMVIYSKQANQMVQIELPFIATEEILMVSVQRGKNRQKIHELLKHHAYRAARRVKEDGRENDLIERIARDDEIPINEEELEKIMVPQNFIGRAPEQTKEFLKTYVKPVLKKYKKITGKNISDEIIN